MNGNNYVSATGELLKVFYIHVTICLCRNTNSYMAVLILLHQCVIKMKMVQ